uniref:Protein kinase domain-containing protein n=1 Tax=Sarcophilus harrisii TaxID=9305 RepID=A0A7N4NRU7_SARHA
GVRPERRGPSAEKGLAGPTGTELGGRPRPGGSRGLGEGPACPDRWPGVPWGDRPRRGVRAGPAGATTGGRTGPAAARVSRLLLLFPQVDALEFIHENEYVHGNISAENIFVNPDTPGQVTLAGYSFVFRYCPGGKHVPCVEKKRDPHQGTLEFISLDLHRGTDPSRRSDLQALGYCLLKWLYGALPWTGQLPDAQAVMGQKERFLYNVAELVRRSCGQRKPSEALKAFLKAVMALQYEEKPDYRMLQTVLAPALEQYHLMPYSPISF